MLRRTLRGFQLQRQHYADSIAYSSAFASRNEHDVCPYQRATALYSPAAASIRRRKWHGERQKKYEAKRKLISAIAREDLGMNR
ncbi:unspecified product [Leptomonas pyrrhocoris]|uniref:Unspecified product n=1 Tax=Leptomonas pyrrhocoris TaxID=157538 RepID=A0A0N1J494_LEPPY|nr:unspecified product [Leptomonas pyrrhocoris]KPA74008.1 unspecified product [Leptomonas pyrrhocoris]|eukprot:XP_015652447.1 unspecified product [Leptomonas pyrrhocoris]